MTQQITADAVIEAYVKTRDLIDAKKKALATELEELEALQQRREKWLAGELDRLGLTNMSRKGVGTAFFETLGLATVSNPEVYFAWIGQDFAHRRHYLENRVSKSAIEQDLKDGIPPAPGVDYKTIRKIKIQRGKGSKEV